MIEAELKARLAHPEAVRAALAAHGPGERTTYRDIYFDTPTATLDAQGREVRLRTVEAADHTQHLLTYKEPAVDVESGSKPEHETAVATPAAVVSLLEGLGLVRLVELTKECENFRCTQGGRDFLATIVRVPELDGTFLEIETMAVEDEVDQALTAVRELFGRLGVTRAELTTELYTDAVQVVRANR